MTGTLHRNVITLDEDIPTLASRQADDNCRVRVSLALLPKEAAKDENRRLLAEINDALADGPDADEKKLRDRMMRRRRDVVRGSPLAARR